MKVDNLYVISQRLLKQMPASFVKIESHDTDDRESPDRLWIELTPEMTICSGEYIDISPFPESNPEMWFAEHCSADNVGGHPTLWDCMGTIDEVEYAVVGHLDGE